MEKIATHSFRILADHLAVYRFMTEIYERDWRNGVPAPFFEYALSSDWMDKSYTHRYQLWLEGEHIVAFCFSENPVSDVYFSLRPGYEALAPEMIDYAQRAMPRPEGKHRLVLFGAQAALIEAARQAGYEQRGGWAERVYDFTRPLDHPLPEGYRFAPHPHDPVKISKCCWYGFENDGPWGGNGEAVLHILRAPHATPERSVAIEDMRGEYVCYAGMWWVPESGLAYLEPLCTLPEHRRKGLAAAAMSELYRQLAPLGATHMTGGGDPFYAALGFEPIVQWQFWEKA